MKNSLKDLILKNAWLKLLSFALAILAWCGIMNISDPMLRVTIRQINVAKHNENVVTSSDMIYDITQGDIINITVSGPRSMVQKLTKDDVDAYVDLNEISMANACPIHVKFKNPEIANRVEVVSKSEDVMKLKLENMVTKHKPIQVEIIGSSEGYFPFAEVEPLMVEVYASEAMVDSIEKFVAKVDITDRKASFQEKCEVVAYASSGAVVENSKFKANIEECNVSVTMYRTKAVNIKLNTRVQCEYGFYAEEPIQAPATIEIAGPSDELSHLTDIIIPVDFIDVKETVNTNINIIEYLPDNCHLVSDIDKVSITIPVVRLDVEKVFEARISDISKNGLSGELRVSNPSLDFTVKCYTSAKLAETLTVSDLGLYIDCSEIKVPGSYKLPLQVKDDVGVIIAETEVSIIFDKALNN